MPPKADRFEDEAICPNPDDCGCCCCCAVLPKGDGLPAGAAVVNPDDCGCCAELLPKGDDENSLLLPELPKPCCWEGTVASWAAAGGGAT